MKPVWAIYDGEELFSDIIFHSRQKAREYSSNCKDCYGIKFKIVKLVAEPEKKRNKVEYFICRGWYYKIQNNKVYTYWEKDKCWGVIPSVTTPEWVRENMAKVDFKEIRENCNG